MLYNISPDTLTQFLDSGKKEFKLVQSAEDKSNTAHLVIFRKENEVLVSDTPHCAVHLVILLTLSIGWRLH